MKNIFKLILIMLQRLFGLIFVLISIILMIPAALVMSIGLLILVLAFLLSKGTQISTFIEKVKLFKKIYTEEINKNK